MASGAYGRTSGTDTRESRPMMERLLLFSLREELLQLRAEDPWREGDRNSRTLAKDVDFRVLLTALRDGATIEENDGDARTSLQLLEGRATLHLAPAKIELEANDVAVIDAGHGWKLTATGGECALLLTLAWPREKSDV